MGERLARHSASDLSMRGVDRVSVMAGRLAAAHHGPVTSTRHLSEVVPT
jgi:hypothetical protein